MCELLLGGCTAGIALRPERYPWFSKIVPRADAEFRVSGVVELNWEGSTLFASPSESPSDAKNEAGRLSFCLGGSRHTMRVLAKRVKGGRRENIGVCELIVRLQSEKGERAQCVFGNAEVIGIVSARPATEDDWPF
jgi:hypothetical protein